MQQTHKKGRKAMWVSRLANSAMRTKTARLVLVTHRQGDWKMIGVFGMSLIVPAISIVLLISMGSWRVWPVVMAFVLMAAVVWRIMVTFAVTHVYAIAAAAAMGLVFAGAAIGVPCCAPAFGGGHSRELEQLKNRWDEIVKLGKTPNPPFGRQADLREIEEAQSILYMRITLTIMLWQYTALSGAMALLVSGRKDLNPIKVIAGLERRTTFVLASLALFVSTLVICLKVSAALAAAHWAEEVERIVWEHSVGLFRTVPRNQPGIATWITSTATMATGSGRSVQSGIREACALSIWELSLLFASLAYFVIDQIAPYSTFRRGRSSLFTYRVVAGALTFGGTLAAFFTVVRIIQVIALWPVGFRFQL